MGVPRFFRWLAERYPFINQAAGNGIKPEFDCLYLDMNGIIHNCVNKGASQSDLTFEPAMYEKIYAYIDKLFNIVQPKKLLFLALDGVAPRAKMNQQRQRRFRSAAEAKEARDAAAARGETIIDDPFDSNCITPGTQFMDRLSAHMEYFIRMKIRDDASWRGIQVIFSGADAVGEGEHKILRYIRNMKMQPDYNPNLRHCLYGLDADLIMLSLLSHEPHMALLREEVVFGSGKSKLNRKVLVKPDEFQFLHISLLREYLQLEFSEAELKLPFEYNFERILDDWILLGFLVGNDFLPNLPSMDIGEGGLDNLYKLYKEILPSLGGYITHWGNLNRVRFEAVVRCLSMTEDTVFRERAAQKERDLERGNRYGGSGRGGTGIAEWASPTPKGSPSTTDNGEIAAADEPVFSFDAAVESTAAESASRHKKSSFRKSSKAVAEEEANPEEGDITLQSGRKGRSRSRSGSRSRSNSRTRGAHSSKAVQPKKTGFVDLPSSDSEEEVEGSEENLYEDPYLNAQNYYRRKFPEFFPGTAENAALPEEERKLTTDQHIAKLCAAYIEGICWCLKYYYAGIQSWRWFYPYRFVPLASSLRNLDQYQFAFDLGRPFTPLEQLLGVLPPLSAALLPEPYRHLMLDVTSPIKDFYPEEFEVDMNDKRNSWEGIALIPFIDEKRLMDAVRSIDPTTLTVSERERNRTTEKYMVYCYDGNNDTTYEPPVNRVNPTCHPIQLCRSKDSLLTIPRIPLIPEWADDHLKATLKALDHEDALLLFGGDETHTGSQVYVGDAAAAENLTPEELKQNFYVEGRFLPILLRGCQTPLQGFPSLKYIMSDAKLWASSQPAAATPEEKEPAATESKDSTNMSAADGTVDANAADILSGVLDPKAKIDVFGMASRKASFCLNLPQSRVNRFATAPGIVKLIKNAESSDKGLPHVWCDYPYVREALAVKVMDSTCEYIFSSTDGSAQYRALSADGHYEFKATANKIAQILSSRCGVRAGNISAIMFVRLFEGMERLADGSVRKRFSKEVTRFPAQLVVTKQPFVDGRFVESEPIPFEQRFKPGTKFMYVGRGYYGSEGEIVEITKTSEAAQAEAAKCATPEQARKCVPTARVKLTVLPPPNVTIFKRLLASPLAQLEFFPSYMLARELGISGYVLSQICTTVTFGPGNVDAGLNIRFSRLGLQVADYARRVKAWGGVAEGDVAQGEERSTTSSIDIRNNNIFANASASEAQEGVRQPTSPEASPDTQKYRGNDGEQWHYSSLTAVVIAEYIKMFPEIFTALSQRSSNSRPRFGGINIAPYLKEDQDPTEYLENVKRWLNKLALASQIAVPCDSLVVPARAALVIEELGEREHTEIMNAKPEIVEINDVTDREIYPYNPPVAWSPTDSVDIALADRVITLRSDDGVPVNTRGTVVAVHGDVNEVIFDVPFVSGSKLNGKCKSAKGKLIHKKSLLNLTQAQPQLPSGEAVVVAAAAPLRRQKSAGIAVAADVSTSTAASSSTSTSREPREGRGNNGKGKQNNTQPSTPGAEVPRPSALERQQSQDRKQFTKEAPKRQPSNTGAATTTTATAGAGSTNAAKANISTGKTNAVNTKPASQPQVSRQSSNDSLGAAATSSNQPRFPPAPTLAPNLATILRPGALSAPAPASPAVLAAPVATPVAPTTPATPNAPATPVAPADATDLSGVRALLDRIRSGPSVTQAQAAASAGAAEAPQAATPYAYVPAARPYGVPPAGFYPPMPQFAMPPQAPMPPNAQWQQAMLPRQNSYQQPPQAPRPPNNGQNPQ